jgi:hypothetical protein
MSGQFRSRQRYRSSKDLARLRILSWRATRSADSLASRTVAWDSSLFANASKVLSTRVLLPIAPQRHSAASALSNSGEYILSTWPLPCPGQKLMDAPIYRCRFKLRRHLISGTVRCRRDYQFFLDSLAAVELNQPQSRARFFLPPGSFRSRIEDHVLFR